MTISLSTIRRLRLVAVAALAAMAVAGPATGSTAQGVPPQSAIDNASATWAAKAKLLDVYGQPIPGATLDSTSGGRAAMDWGAFGIGAGAVLGLVLLVSGLAAGAHYSRRRMHPRPAA